MPKEEADAASNDANVPISGSISMLEPLPALRRPHRKRKAILVGGLILATLDLCCLPITYYYALKFDTNLKLQDGINPRRRFRRHPADVEPYSVRSHYRSLWTN